MLPKADLLLLLFSALAQTEKTVLIFRETQEMSNALSEAISDMLGQDGWIPSYASYGELQKQLSTGDFKMIAFPGASGDSLDFAAKFTSDDLSGVRDFISKGGLYYGICMGAAIGRFCL